MNDIAPLISVIVATRNAAKDIDTLLLSISSQTFKNYEVIVVDGLSADDTIEVASKFRDIFPLTTISEADNGIYDAMNKGIARSRGKWLIFMGADDQFYDDLVFSDFSKLLSEKSASDLDLIFGNFVFRGRVFQSRLNWRIVFTNPLNHQSVFYNRVVFDQYQYNLAYKYAADYDLNIKLYLRNAPYLHFDRIIAFYKDTGLSTRYREYSNYEMQLVRTNNLGALVARFIELLRRMRKMSIKYGKGVFLA